MFFSSGRRSAFEQLVDLVTHLIEHRPGDADTAGVGERLDAGGDVDAVAEDAARRRAPPRPPRCRPTRTWKRRLGRRAPDGLRYEPSSVWIAIAQRDRLERAR